MSKLIGTLLLGIILGAALMWGAVALHWLELRGDPDFELREISNSLRIYQLHAEIAKDQGAMTMLALDGLIDRRIAEEPEAVIEHLHALIEQSSNPAIRRSLRFRLGEIYFDYDQTPKAIEQMEKIVLETEVNNPAESAFGELLERANTFKGDK